MNAVTEAPLLTSTAKCVLKTLLYFDVFEYPLNLDELFTYHSEKLDSPSELQLTLDQMIGENLICRFGNFYTVHNRPELVEKRIERNKRAEDYMVKAIEMTKIISTFPFVKMVSLSGSLSKNTADQNSDIDYFIITKPGRVWVTRFLLTFYKKTILLNNSKYFCTNLIMSEDRLRFEDKSHYIATEIVSLLPLFGKENYQKFMAENQWTADFFPNSISREKEIVIEKKGNSLVSRILEKVLTGKLGDYLDKTWQEIIKRKWRNDHKNRLYVMENPTDYIEIQPHIAKGHGGDQYPRIRKAYQQKLAEFENKMGISL